MLFSKTNHLVGLDIGSSMVKAAEILDSKKGRILKRFGTMDLKAGAIEDGLIRDPEYVAGVIRELFSLYGIRNDKVALSIGGYSAIVKKITMPAMEEEALQKSILVEAEQYIPFDIKDIRMDFQVMGPSSQNPEHLNILLVAAKKELVNQYVEVAELAGLTPCVVDVDALAVQNVYEAVHGITSEEVVLLNVGAAKMSLNIIKDGDSVFMRDVSLGCRQINSRIRAFTGCSEEDAEALKLASGGEKMPEDEYLGAVGQVVGQWCTEIGRALDFFYSTYPGERVEKMVLSGGGGYLETFVDALSVQSGAEVLLLDPFGAVQVDSGKLDAETLRKMAPQAAVVMGLALRKVEDK
ncbi:type IV pilus assembly protein PilM [Desulfobotulus alkaliphilus]|uniref:Type IV pilus assembly protein PilM n=1 Tax=Desulfobotulus alkaliphilus TaxID=622671 RepID=A0A562RYF7_9BACT|nr:type IV pilus assembly protein PilM [Desulfobotulus alkaliphilus]TWI74121.1 type IV pilus assembly protein PilM [Desulfobotulus alkaliphilus]